MTFADGDVPVTVDGLVDFRAVQTDSEVGFFDGGRGKTRFGGSRRSGSRFTGGFGEIAATIHGQFGSEINAFVHLKHDGDQRVPVDAVEIYGRYRPVSTSAWRLSGKTGALFPPVSMENIDTVWQSPYTVTWSAINSWIGEEVRSLGGEFLLAAYDKFADEAATRRGRGACRTRFLSAGFGYFLPYDIELLSQVMYGDTERLTPDGVRLDASFAAAYLLASRFIDTTEKHQLSIRYDWFKTDDENILPNRTPVDEVGDAWTLAYSYRPTEDHRLSYEILTVKSRRSARVNTGVSAKQRDTTFQTSYRFTF